jgi:LPXTG-motif cell wall-anchored protein
MGKAGMSSTGVHAGLAIAFAILFLLALALLLVRRRKRKDSSIPDLGDEMNHTIDPSKEGADDTFLEEEDGWAAPTFERPDSDSSLSISVDEGHV